MNKTVSWIIVAALCGGIFSASGESLLKLASFPKTFSDVSFQTRVDVLSDGYDAFESVYDSQGRCISGCAYPGITIEDETDAMLRNTRLANESIFEPQGISELYIAPSCTQYRKATSSKIPANSPIDGGVVITSDFGWRTPPKQGATQNHAALDISATIGTRVYATANGVVEDVGDSGNSGGGKYVRIRHTNDAFRTVYMHLSRNDIVKVGDMVQAGCLIGLSGNSGNSTAPHLHYGIYYTVPGNTFNSRTDAIDPIWPKNYLGSQYKFKDPSVKSCLHNPTNFCAENSATPDQIPTNPLPDEIM